MEQNKIQPITKADKKKKKRKGPGPDPYNNRKTENKIRNTNPAFLSGGKNASDPLDRDTKDRQPTGEWVHPITNQDEQEKITNNGNSDILGEKETEGV